MSPEATNWLPGIVALVLGLGTALALVFFRRGSGTDPVDRDLDHEDLKTRLEDLIGQLRALDSEADEERLVLELEAAQILRRLDAWQPKELSDVDAERGDEGLGRTALILTGAGLATAVLVPLMLVIPALSEREEGGSVTGNDGLAAAPRRAESAAPPQHMDFGKLKARAAAEPENVDLQLQMAAAYLRIGRFMDVFEAAKRVLDRQPDHPQALTFMAAVSLRMGKHGEAEGMMKKVLAAGPPAPEAHLLLAMAQLKQGKAKEALLNFETMLKLDPRARASVAPLIREAQVAAGIDAGPPPPSPDPHQGLQAQGAAAPLPSGPGIKLKVILPEPLKAKAKPGTVVFVYARAPGVSAGPPLAVKKIPVSSLPVSIELNDGDMMMGGRLPPVVDLHARLDDDGIATTKTGTEPYARLQQQRRGGPVSRLVLGNRAAP